MTTKFYPDYNCEINKNKNDMYLRTHSKTKKLEKSQSRYRF